MGNVACITCTWRRIRVRTWGFESHSAPTNKLCYFVLAGKTRGDNWALLPWADGAVFCPCEPHEEHLPPPAPTAGTDQAQGGSRHQSEHGQVHPQWVSDVGTIQIERLHKREMYLRKECNLLFFTLRIINSFTSLIYFIFVLFSDDLIWNTSFDSQLIRKLLLIPGASLSLHEKINIFPICKEYKENNVMWLDIY